MKNLKLLTFIFSILVLATIGHCRVFQPDDAKLIEQTCQKTFNHDLCVKLLKADPHSSGADVKGLALIMINAIKAKAKATLNKINQLLPKSVDPKQRIALRECANDYDTIGEANVVVAIKFLQKGYPNIAEAAANDVEIKVISCEAGFFAGESPLTSDNNAMNDIADVTAAIVRLLEPEN